MAEVRKRGLSSVWPKAGNICLKAKAELCARALKVGNAIETVRCGDDNVRGDQRARAEHLAALAGIREHECTNRRIVALGGWLTTDDGLCGGEVGSNTGIVEVLWTASCEEDGEADERAGLQLQLETKLKYHPAASGEQCEVRQQLRSAWSRSS